MDDKFDWFSFLVGFLLSMIALAVAKVILYGVDATYIGC